MKSFEGQVALVTGAGGGIGLAAASAFAEAGASVIMADSNAALLEEAASALRSAGHEVLAVTCDAFEDKVALVTGAGGGIGLATARAFAEAGAGVIMADSNAALLATS